MTYTSVHGTSKLTMFRMMLAPPSKEVWNIVNGYTEPAGPLGLALPRYVPDDPEPDNHDARNSILVMVMLVVLMLTIAI